MNESITKDASSNINGFVYDPDKRTLIVEFKGNRKYQYHDVPSIVVDAFTKSKSFGSFHNKNIRGKYKEQKLD